MGVPGLRGGDHIGITVPDMAEAHAFLVDVLGCDYVYRLPAMRHEDDWMLEHLNVPARRAVNEIRFYRCGFGLNFEVFEYERHDGQRAVPRNSDLGGHHVALYVDDIDGSEAEGTVRFGLDGAEYEIDLSLAHSKELHKVSRLTLRTPARLASSGAPAAAAMPVRSIRTRSASGLGSRHPDQGPGPGPRFGHPLPLLADLPGLG